MTIGDRIKNLRKESGLTLEDTGKAIGVGKATIQKYENGLITSIPSDKIALLADLFGVDPAYIMGWQSVRKIQEYRDDRLESLHQNPRLGILFDRSRKMKPEDIEFMIQMADRIIKERK